MAPVGKPLVITPLPRTESISDEFVPINSLINNPDNATNSSKPQTPKKTGNEVEQNPYGFTISEKLVSEGTSCKKSKKGTNK